MAVSTSLCDSFLLDLLTKDGPDFDGTPNLKLALIASGESGTYGAGTTAYGNLGADEVANGNGYTTGGAAVAVASTYPKEQVDGTMVVDLDDITSAWTSATFSTSGGLLYQDTAGDESVSVYAFSAAPSNGTLTIQWPTPGAASGAVYIARA